MNISFLKEKYLHNMCIFIIISLWIWFVFWLLSIMTEFSKDGLNEEIVKCLSSMNKVNDRVVVINNETTSYESGLRIPTITLINDGGFYCKDSLKTLVQRNGEVYLDKDTDILHVAWTNIKNKDIFNKVLFLIFICFYIGYIYFYIQKDHKYEKLSEFFGIFMNFILIIIISRELLFLVFLDFVTLVKYIVPIYFSYIILYKEKYHYFLAFNISMLTYLLLLY